MLCESGERSARSDCQRCTKDYLVGIWRFRNVYVGFVIMSAGRGQGDWRKPGTGGMFVIGWGRVQVAQVVVRALGGLLAWVSGGIPSFPPRALSKIQRFTPASFLTPLTFPSPSNTDYNTTMSVSSGEDTAPANSSPSTPEMRLTVPNPARKTKRRIAVLTSGGDSAGMNAAGKSTNIPWALNIQRTVVAPGCLVCR